MSKTDSSAHQELQSIREFDNNKYDFKNSEKDITFKAKPGISRDLVVQISKMKGEPQWMLEHRLKCFDIFMSKPLPKWGPDLSEINFDEMYYYIAPGQKKATNWDEVPEEIKDTFDKIGVPEMEKKVLAGSVAQYESEGVYVHLKERYKKMGIIFCDMDTALKEHEELVKKYFMKCVPMTDNKFAALHGAFWSGGSFAYIPKGVKCDLPLQTYFRMNAAQEGQFEHTLIIVEDGAEAHYIEGCTAPRYEDNKHSLHAAIVEIFVKENAKMRYSTVQNWSKNVYNLNTKRAIVEKNAKMEWVGGSLGSKITMLYPMSILKGEGATASHLNIAFGTADTWKDGGAKVVHAAPNTSSKIIAKSISMGGGISVYRGLLRMNKGATNAKSHVQCDALIMDPQSHSYTYPHNEIYEPTATLAHEASVGKISDEQLFYMMSRGLTEDQAKSMIVLGFLDDVLKEIPLEFSVELNRLVQLEMSKLGAVG